MAEKPFRAYSGDEPYVFVCYAHIDADVVYEEIAELAGAGIPVWYDEGIEPSAIWSDSLAHAIEGCTLFLYYLTPQSARSEHCRREISFALDLGLKMLVTVLEPTELSAGLKLLLGTRQAILRYELAADAYREKLRGAITTALGDSSRRGAQPAQPPAPRVTSERRPLTVLCADLVNEPEASWPDPEDWSEGVQAFRNLCQERALKYEARIARQTGDGVVVYFGHPKAHENDAERAVRFALELREEIGAAIAALDVDSSMKPRLRLAVHSGPVIIEADTALTSGPTPKLAECMQELDALDSVLVSNSTLHLVRTHFDVEPRGEHRFPGFGEPVAVHAITRQLSGRRVRVAANTRFVGRQLELAQLTALLERARTGTPMFAVLMGEAGIGKSRLVHEFAKQLQALTHQWLVLQCSPFDAGSPFHPILAALRENLGFNEVDSETGRRALFQSGIKRWGVENKAHIAALADLLEVPKDPGLPTAASRQRRLTIEALAGALFCPTTLTVLHIEDIHWLDPSSLEVIEQVIASAGQAPLLVLMTARPEFEAPASWRGRVITVAVERLLDTDICELIGTLGAGDAAARELAARSDGVPLFAEALAQNLDGDVLASVPQTLQELLFQQLDRLGDARHIAQVAAVFGREFEASRLREILGLDSAALQKHLLSLVEAGLIFHSLSESQNVFLFKHALVQELAYDSLLKKARRDIHRRIGELLEAQYADSTGPHVLAMHFSRARQAERAAEHWLKAGREAFKRSAHVEAASYLRKGLKELPGIENEEARDEREITLQVYLGETLSVLQGYAASSTQQVFERARQLSVARNRSELTFRAVSRLQGVALIQSHIDHALALASELRALAESMQDPKAVADADTLSGITAYRAGHLSEACDFFTRAIDYHIREHRSGSLGSVAAHADAYQINVLWLLGKPDTAVRQAEAALERARSTGHAFNEATVLSCTGATQIFRGEWELCMQVAEELSTLAREHDFGMHSGNALCLRGMALSLGGELHESVEALRTGIESFHALGQGTYATFYQSFLAEAYLKLGELDAADRIVGDTLAHDREMGVNISNAELLRLRACIRHAGKQAAEAESLFTQALELCDEQAMHGFALRVAISRYELMPDAPGAREGLQARLARFDEGLDTCDLLRAASLLDEKIPA